ncbi:MAG: tRNA guanosine(34) transglycosylase Tgt [Planctomycetota bacterium]
MSDSFEIVAETNGARAGLLKTAHGVVETPVYMPVATRAAMRAIETWQMEEMGAQILLANAYHLFLRPGDELVRDLGGLHKFAAWDKPWLTDSGGFQIFSLADLAKVTDDGVRFRSPVDGIYHFLRPEDSIRIQNHLGADIIMAFDECVRLPATPESVAGAVDRTIDWARRSRDAHARDDQLLFGIVQGGTDYALRDRCTAALLELDFPGYAVGGLSVGEDRDAMFDTLRHTTSGLPREKPRYFMGIGKPDDLMDCMARGIDMFDCVLATRNGRSGTLFSTEGRLNMKNARFRADETLLDPAGASPVGRRYSRAYLHHLFKTGELLGSVLGSLHNTWYLVDLVQRARRAIMDGTFPELPECAT